MMCGRSKSSVEQTCMSGIVLRAVMCIAVTGMLSGCASRGRADGSRQEPQERDTVIVAITDEPATLDPVQGWGHGNTPLIQSTLIRYGSDMHFEEDLAVDYQLDASGLVWTFTLRDDAKFTDGEAVTADDVVFTFETAKAAQASVDLTFVERIEAVNDTTVKFVLSRPTSVFLNTAASVGIIPEHAYGADYGTAPVGSGPWKFVQWNPQEQLILEANEDYYGTIPFIKKAAIVFMTEDAAFAAVQAGQVDVALTAATLADARIDGRLWSSSLYSHANASPPSADERK